MLKVLRSSDGKWMLALFVAIAVYSAVFTSTTILKHDTFNSFAWDLGTFDQILHDTAFDGRPFYYTLDLFMNPSGQYFAIHFSPILLLFVPLYRIAPGPELLLALKSTMIGAAAYPLYLIVKRLTGDTRTGAMMGLTFLLSPCIQGANWFDYQPQSLLPLLVFAAYYFLESGSTLYYITAAVLLLSVEEHSSAILIALFAVFLLRDRLGGLGKRLSSRRTRLLVLITVALAFSTLAASIIFKQIYPHDQLYADVYSGGGAYNALGFEGNALTAPLYALTHPAEALNALAHDAPLKAIYLIFLFAPLAFTPLRSGATAIGVLLLAPFLLSNYPPYYMIGAHYPFYVMPLAFIATAHYLKRRGVGGYGAAAVILTSTTVFALALSPLSPASAAFADRGLLWYPQNDMSPADIAGVDAIIASIPPGARVLTQNHLFPHLSGRINAYCIPVTRFDDGQVGAITTYLADLKERSDYILLDMDDGNPLTPTLIHLIDADHAYTQVTSAGEVTLWRRAP